MAISNLRCSILAWGITLERFDQFFSNFNITLTLVSFQVRTSTSIVFIEAISNIQVSGLIWAIAREECDKFSLIFTSDLMLMRQRLVMVPDSCVSDL